MNSAQAKQLLGLNASADFAEVKKAYRSLAMKHHPDRVGGCEAKFKDIKEAYEFLEKYSQDSTIKNGNSQSTGSFDDIMREAFRTAGKSSFNKEWFDQNSYKDYNQTKEFREDVNIPLEKAFNGGVLNVYVPGFGEHKISISVGVSEGDLVKTIYDSNGLCEMYAKIISDYKIDWSNTSTYGDITKEIKVPALRMIMGGWFDVETLDNKKVSVRIPAGLEANKLLKIQGRGYWKTQGRSKERGDMYLRVIPLIQKFPDLSLAEVNEFVNLCRSSVSETVKQENEFIEPEVYTSTFNESHDYGNYKGF